MNQPEPFNPELFAPQLTISEEEYLNDPLNRAIIALSHLLQAETDLTPEERLYHCLLFKHEWQKTTIEKLRASYAYATSPQGQELVAAAGQRFEAWIAAEEAKAGQAEQAPEVAETDIPTSDPR